MQKLLILTLFLCVIVNAQAQDNPSSQQDTTIKTMPFQASWFYPLSSNGIAAKDIRNAYSFNMWVGVSSGVDVVEMAGFGNITRGNVKGAQFAGIFNVNKGNVNGFQGAGYLNIVKGSTKGVQLTSFLNVNTGTFKGAQLAGVVNCNWNNVRGGQFSGVGNLTVGSVRGVQISTYVNVITDTLNGVQASTFLNYAKVVHGHQLGFINISDTVTKGLPIGFFSFVRKGYHKVELEGNSILYANAFFKTGVKKFYNIFGIGAGSSRPDFVWGFTYGLGTMLVDQPKFNLNMDLTSTALLGASSYFTVSSLTKLKLSGAYVINKNLSLYAGPSLDLLVRDNQEQSVISNPMNTWYFDSYTTIQTTIGIHGGIRF
jgi:hypothetical protein